MIRAALSAAGLMLAVGLAQAQETPPADPMAATYGNTITIDIPPFYSARQFIDPDHTWRQVDSEGDVVLGTWKVEDGKVCFSETQPAGPTRCHPAVPRKVGDRWTNEDPAVGATIEIGLVAGRK